MSQEFPNIETSSLDTAVENYKGIIRQALALTKEVVQKGNEDAMIFKLGKFKMDALQPLLGMIKFESGSQSDEDNSGEIVMDSQADNEIGSAIRDIEHRVQELEKQKQTIET